MTEFVSPPSGPDKDPDNFEWATLASTGTDIKEPLSAKRESGWLFQEKVPYNTLNWFFFLAASMIAWLRSWKVRAFSSLESGIDVADDGHLFIVGRPGGFTAPMGELWGEVGEGAAVPVPTLSVDGSAVYYARGSVVYKASREDGSLIASYDATQTINRIFADGGGVFLVTAAGGGLVEVVRLDRDLANPALEGTNQNYHDVASNGAEAVVSSESSFNADVFDAAGSLVGSINFGAIVRRCFVDHGVIFLAGDDAGGLVQLRAYDRQTFALLWSTAFPAEVNTNDVVSDGDLLFVATDVESVDGTSFNLLCYNRVTGALLWSSAVPQPAGSSDAVSCCVDHMSLFVSSGSVLYEVDKRTGQTFRQYDHGGTINAVDCDGDAIFLAGDAGTGGSYIRRLNAGRGSATFVKASGSDRNRRPFANLAIPTS